MGRSDEQGEGSRSVAEEFSRLLGIELEHEPVASEAWEAQSEAEASAEAKQADWVAALQKEEWVRYYIRPEEEEASSYEKDQRAAALSTQEEDAFDYRDMSKGC
jgi:hypothetical protein